MVTWSSCRKDACLNEACPVIDRKGWGVAAVIVLMLGCSAAHSGGSGAIALGFEVETLVDVQSNPTLDKANPQRLEQASTALSFGVLTQTRSQQLSLAGGISLREADGPGGAVVASGVVDPFMAVKYFRQTRAASFRFDAQYEEVDLSQTDPLDVGALLVTGTAKRRLLGAEISLRWREDTPLAFGVLAAAQKVTYQEGMAIGQGGQALNGTARQKLELMARLDLTKVSHLTTSLAYRSFQQESVSGSRESFLLDAVYHLGRPLGAVKINLGYVATDAGHRLGGSVERDYEFRTSALSVSAGATRAASGDGFLTGHFAYQIALPLGAFDVSLQRKIASSDQDDTEQISTEIGMRYLIKMTPLDGFQVSIDLAKAKNTLTGLATINRAVGFSYARELNRDANLKIGLRRRDVRDTITGAGHSDEIYLSLTRNFNTHY